MLFAFAAAVTIATDFEGGSLGRVEQVDRAHFRLAARGERDQDGRNRQANWYFFRVSGATPGQALTLDIVDLPGEYNYQPNRGAITKDTPPVISVDNKSWRHIETFEYDPAEPKLRLRVTAPAATFWIAHVPPYTGRHLQRLRRDLRAGPEFREEVAGRSLGGRPIYLWTLGKGGKTIWLMFRQHSWEAGSSWTGEGALREIAARPELRRDVTWKVFPLCDPDGVARGGVRFNARGFDLNRNWDTRDAVRMPEITAQRNAIESWLRGGRGIALFFSLHNTETSEYLEGPPTGHRELAERLFALLTERTAFHPSRPLFFSSDSTTPGKPGRQNVIQALSAEHQLPAFLMEQRIAYNEKLRRLPLATDRVAFGRMLAEVFYEAVTGLSVSR